VVGGNGTRESNIGGSINNWLRQNCRNDRLDGLAKNDVLASRLETFSYPWALEVENESVSWTL
jgi:hypothetical protein